MRIRRGLSRALASVSILTTATAMAVGTLPSVANAAAGQTAQPASATRAAARAQAGPPAGLALARAAARAAAAAHPGTAPDAAAGSITGSVRGIGGAVLPGACVTATGPGGSVTSRTRGSGRYLLTGLLPGSYTVSYRDCAQPRTYFPQWYGGTALATGATRVTIQAGQPTPLAPVTLRATHPAAEVAATQKAMQDSLAGLSAAGSGGVISGTAKTRSGKPVRGICVDAESANSGWGGATGRHGGYSLPVGTKGRWTVMFTGGCGSTGSYAPQWWRHVATSAKATKLTERPGRSFRGISAVLRPGATITGTVSSATTGAGVGGVCVEADGLRGMRDVSAFATTRANGTYTMKNLGTGRFHLAFFGECAKADYLDASRKAAVSVTDGKTTSGINATLRPGAEIHGVVTSAATGAPVSGVCVDDQNGDEDITRANGSYALTNMRAGSYTLSFDPTCIGGTASYAPQYYDNVANELAATPVDLSGGQVQTGFDAALQPGGTVTGQVTNRSGAPLAGVCVSVVSRNAAGLLGQDPYLDLLAPIFVGNGGFGDTGPKGHFTVRDLLPGQYLVQFTGGCGHGSAQYTSQVFAPQGGGQWISVSGGSVTAGVNGHLRVGGIITGTVTGRGGKALREVCVSAVEKGVPAWERDSVDEPVSGRDGGYRVIGLATGRYAVNFQPCGDQPYAPQWYKGAAREGTAHLVSVSAGHTTRHISVTLVSGGTLTGVVHSGITGGLVGHACVLVVDPAGIVTGGALTSSSGQYTIRHLPAGQWTLDPSMCEAAHPSLAGVVRTGYRIRNARTTAASFTLPQAGSLSGTVQGGSPAAAEPGICVEATPLTGHGQPSTGVTGADGSYTLPGLAAGSYRVLFTPLCLVGTAAVAPQWYNGASSRSAATPVSVSAGQTTAGIGGTLADDGAISGTVTVSGTATAGVCVGAYAGTSATPAAIAITGSDGSYQLSGLPAASYSVEFSTGCGTASYATQWYGGATRAAATPVAVTAGSTATGIDAS